jgi:rubredoxin
MPEPETVGFYDPAEHDGVVFEGLPDGWRCPRCKQGKEKFNKA